MQDVRSLVKSVAYGLLDVSTARRGMRRVINGEPIRFPARWYRYYPADYEAETFAFLRTYCRPGHTALDIGAHIGLFSVVMARLVDPTGRVFSFEPTPLTNEVLKETVRLNGCAEVVEVRGEAVARTSGSTTFYDTGDAVSNANSLLQTQRSKGGIPVQTVGVDDFVAARGLSVQCLKIDVEGAELDVLRGASRTFSACRPAVLLALHPDAIRQGGGTLEEIWELLQEYRMSVLHLNKPVDEHWFSQQRELFDVTLIPL